MQPIFNPIEIKANLILVLLRRLDDERFALLIKELEAFLEKIKYESEESINQTLLALFDLINAKRSLLAFRHHLGADIQVILDSPIPWINRKS